jgi:4-amino-4-deoxy-L-arabinose transferase-like glycosyltransferase
MKKYHIVIIILIIAFLMRVWSIGNTEFSGDENAYAFRAVGYLDYLGTSLQTQPIDWYKNTELPAWTKLSFHDHPPLYFAVQHIFFKIFGDSIITSRLPAVFAGVIATMMVLLLAQALARRISGNENVQKIFPIFSMLVFAVQYGSVWIFQVSLIEGMLIPLILANMVAFFWALENKKHWWTFGITLGLVALTKYTGVILIPIYAIMLLARYRAQLREKQFYGALIIALIIFAPVIIYNTFLFIEHGHFDLQFAYLLGQETPEWQNLIGKTQNPFSAITTNFPRTYGTGTLVLTLMGLVLTARMWIRKEGREGIMFVWLCAITTFALFFAVGSAPRFLAMWSPLTALLIAYGLAYVWVNKKYTRVLKGMVVIIILYMVGHTVYVQKTQSADYGVGKLDQFFEREFAGKVSGITPGGDHPQLNKVIQKFAEKKSEKPQHFSMIIYNDQLSITTILWNFTRRMVYHSIPAMFIENFESVLSMQGKSFFDGFTLYFVQSKPGTLLNTFKREKTGEAFESRLREAGIEPMITIHNSDGEEAFRVYQFSIDEL